MARCDPSRPFFSSFGTQQSYSIMDHVPKRAALPIFSEREYMTCTCAVHDDENVPSSAGFPAVLNPTGCINISHLPVSEATHDLGRIWLRITASQTLFSNRCRLRWIFVMGCLAVYGWRTAYPAYDGCRCRFRQSSSASADTYTGLNPFCSGFCGGTQEALHPSAANASSAAVFIRLLSLAIANFVSTSPFHDGDAEDLYLLQFALAFLSLDLAVVVSTAEVNLRLFDRDTYLAASMLLLTVKDTCWCSEIRPQAVFGPTALQAVQDHRDAFTTVMSSTMTNFAKVVASAVHPPCQFHRTRASVVDMELGVTSSSSINNSNGSISRSSPGDAVLSRACSWTEMWTMSAAVGVDNACSGYLHSGFLTFLQPHIPSPSVRGFFEFPPPFCEIKLLLSTNSS